MVKNSENMKNHDIVSAREIHRNLKHPLLLVIWTYQARLEYNSLEWI
jgi:hypothetical protein